MYIELILGGEVAQILTGGKIFLWMDNFSAHSSPTIDATFAENSVCPAFYPANMTARLQVLDLIVNGPIKRNIKACRSNVLRATFAAEKARHAECFRLNIPWTFTWNPTRTTITTCISNLLNLFAGDFKRMQFWKSIMKSFVDTGSCFDEARTFRTYTAKPERGSVINSQAREEDVVGCEEKGEEETQTESSDESEEGSNDS